MRASQRRASDSLPALRSASIRWLWLLSRYRSYVTKGRDKGEALLFGSMFILGMVLTHFVLGLIAGLGGKAMVGCSLGFVACALLAAGARADHLMISEEKIKMSL